MTDEERQRRECVIRIANISDDIDSYIQAFKSELNPPNDNLKKIYLTCLTDLVKSRQHWREKLKSASSS